MSSNDVPHDKRGTNGAKPNRFKDPNVHNKQKKKDLGDNRSMRDGSKWEQSTIQNRGKHLPGHE